MSGDKEEFGLGKTGREEVQSVGCVPNWYNGLSLRFYYQRADRQNLFVFCLFYFLFICVLVVSQMRLGKILAQSRITVPEINGEALDISKVASRFTWQNTAGCGKRGSSHHCMVPATIPGNESLRSTQNCSHRSSPSRS